MIPSSSMPTRSSPLTSTTAALLLLGACAGDSGGSDGATDGGFTSTASATGATTSATAGESDSDSAAQGSDSASDSATTTGATDSDSDSDSDSDADSDTATTSDVPGYCGDDPPQGYMVAADPTCMNEPNVGTFDPVVEWQKTAWTAAPASNQVMMSPIVIDLDGDQLPDLLYITYSGADYLGAGVLRAISGDGQVELLSIDGQGIYGSAGIAAGDIDGDGQVELVTFAAPGVVKAFEHDGALKWSSPVVSQHIAYISFAAPAIADLDGDGAPEIIAGRAILNSDGTLRGAGEHGVGAHSNYGSTSFGADIDGDGVQEVVVGNALYRPDGAAIWFNGQADGYPAVADFDLDGTPEIVVVTAGGLRLQAGDGAVLWSVANPGGVGGPPTIADFDGDGFPEVGVAGAAAYVVFDGDGSVLWQVATQDASSAITGSSVYDFEGDGIADVVYADEVNLYVYSGVDGAVKLLYEPHNSGTLIEYPIVVDVDNDGQVEIIVAHNNLIQSSFGVTVLGDKAQSWRPGRKLWNQHAYSITNVTDSGAIPKKPEPNWIKHNNFRSGDISPNVGLAAPDLQMITPESCLSECTGADEATVWVQLGNVGAAPLTAGVTIEVYGTINGEEGLLKVENVDIQLQPGEFAAAIPIVINTTDLESLRLVAKPGEAECNVDPANEILLQAPFCVAPG
jgi:hypothetical protein